MYYPYFITYMAIGLALSLGVFFWALKSGQFKEQQRARFLPLKDMADRTMPKKSLAGRYEVYILWGMALVGLMLTGMILINAVLKS